MTAVDLSPTGSTGLSGLPAATTRRNRASRTANRPVTSSAEHDAWYMVALRSARLEALLSARIELVQHADLMTLINNRVPEAFDLDFKSEMYGPTEKDRRDAATDVAAFANTAGGLLVLGIEEDDQARATAAPGLELSEADERRIRQIVGSQVVPMPLLDVLRVEDQDRPRHGLVLIAVPRSPLAPHAVVVNDGLRYPRRNGATTRYLSEPEVADAYRQRFAAFRQQADRANEVETDALDRLATTEDQAWIVVSLVPDLAGDLVINQVALNAVRNEMMGRQPLIMPAGLSWRRVSIGRRRILADGNMDNSRRARFLSANLHYDGAGTFAAFVLGRRLSQVVPNAGEPEARQIDDEMVVNGILSGLRFLARHARDRTAAGGNALIRARLYPVGGQQPLRLTYNRGFGRGFGDSLGDRIITDVGPPPERVAALDALATDGPDLVAAAYLLATDVFQEFGWAEAAQFTSDGRVRLQYWGAEWQAPVGRWAADAGITTTQETL
jgi:Putative DNA-binding domain